MKRIYIFFALLAMLAFATTACAGDNDRITQTRKVADFTRIEVTTVGQVYFTQSPEVSFPLPRCVTVSW